MARAKVALLRTRPETARRDYHDQMNLAGNEDVVARDAETALEVDISWHFFFPDSFWYPARARRAMPAALASPRGGLFRNWEHVTPDADGYPLMGTETAVALRTGPRALLRSLGIPGACLEEAPEFTARRRRAATPRP